MMPRKRVFKPDEPTFRVCLYSQKGCNLPREKECPLAAKLKKITDVQKWQRTALNAQHCEHIGEELTRHQYNAHKQGVIV